MVRRRDNIRRLGRYFHRSLFLETMTVLFIVVLLGVAVDYYFSALAYDDRPVYQYVVGLAPMEAWSLLCLIMAGLLTMGLFHNTSLHKAFSWAICSLVFCFWTVLLSLGSMQAGTAIVVWIYTGVTILGTMTSVSYWIEYYAEVEDTKDRRRHRLRVIRGAESSDG